MDTPDGAAVVPGPEVAPLAKRVAAGPRPRWPAGTRWVLAAAVLASVLALATWAGMLWHYLQPSAFRGSLMLGPPLSLGFVAYVAGAVAHVALITGAAAALAGWRGARRLMLVAGLGVLALGVVHFAQFSLFPPLSVPRRGPDFIVGVTIDAAHQIAMAAPYLLLVLVLARVSVVAAQPAAESAAAAEPLDAGGGGAGEGRGDQPRELGYYVDRELGGRADNTLTALIVLVAVIESAGQLAQWAALMWIQFQPSEFRSIATGWGSVALAVSGVLALLHLSILAGAGALVMRRWGRGRRLLLAAAVALILMWVGSYVYGVMNPPPGMPVDRGAEFVVNTTVSVGRVVTVVIVYALLALAMTRARGGTLPRG